jgi:hypothetical protein
MYECIGASPGTLRGGGNAITGTIKVFHITPDGKREEAAEDDEEHLKEALCSKHLLSKLHPCETDPIVIARAYEGPPMYPMADAYRKAARDGVACPLPAPFMDIVNGKCCVTTNPHVWPNICPSREWIGKDSSPTRWNLNANINVHTPLGDDPLFPVHVYKIGRPDVPSSYSKWRPTYLQILIYVALYMVIGAMLGYVYNKLDEETAVVRGQKREQMFYKSRKPPGEPPMEGKPGDGGFLSSDSEDTNSTDDELESIHPNDNSLMSDALYPSVTPPPEQGEQVSMAFGLLPGLPRGRSTMPTNESVDN